jgi:hypothetical protein
MRHKNTHTDCFFSAQAIILKQSLTSANVSGIEHVINELTDVILNAQKQSKKGIKAQKV